MEWYGVRPMKTQDVSQVVAVHLQAFPGFFLSFLGKDFLTEIYFSLINDASGIGFVYEEGTMIHGFVAGTDEPSGFYRRLLQQRWWRFGLAAIKPLLQQPAILPRLIRAFSMPKEASLPDKTGTLLSIAVMPESHGSGVGQTLVKEFLNEAKRRGLEQVNLTTDQENNDRTNRFYQKMGFSCIRSYITPEGRKMNEYMIRLLAE